ncbi:HPr family phosphocarrier protein [Maricaulaceae bacterium EIL42A08]|nr:HPr family phosphocarrier protein [Maricaulaceae bacterium EIL42A08]MCP2680124.1 HPr family phosphocarrier protein [Maricaulaceae bacterium NA33B04]
MTPQRTVTICNERGLHARASAKFVAEADRFDADVSVTRNAETVTADSALDLMMLAAGIGSQITIGAAGPDADAAVEALADLVERGFDE